MSVIIYFYFSAIRCSWDAFAPYFIKLMFPNILVWGLIKTTWGVTDFVLPFFTAEMYNVR